VAVVVLSIASVFVLQALAMVARALDATESRSIVYDFAVSKMAEIEADVRATGLSENKTGSFRIGPQQFDWEVVFGPVSWAVTLESATLAVAWRQGSRTYKSQFSTVVSLPQKVE